MKMKQAKTFALLLLFVLTFAFASSTSLALAKNLNVPDDTVIIYYTGGMGTVTLPTPLKIIGQVTGGYYLVDKIEIIGVHIEGGNIASGDFLVVHFMPNNQPNYPDIPWAVFTTSTDTAFLTLWHNFLIGSPVYIPNTFDNVISVPDALMVDRHGNSITINLTSDQQIKVTPGAHPIYFTLPAFTMELDKVGGSVHTFTTKTLTGYKLASMWTETQDKMGFYGEGSFTCSAWSPDIRPVTDSFITMHGIATMTPP